MNNIFLIALLLIAQNCVLADDEPYIVEEGEVISFLDSDSLVQGAIASVEKEEVGIANASLTSLTPMAFTAHRNNF